MNIFPLSDILGLNVCAPPTLGHLSYSLRSAERFTHSLVDSVIPFSRIGNKQIKQIKFARISLVTTFIGLVLPCFGEFDLFDLFDLFVANSALLNIDNYMAVGLHSH